MTAHPDSRGVGPNPEVFRAFCATAPRGLRLPVGQQALQGCHSRVLSFARPVTPWPLTLGRARAIPAMRPREEGTADRS